MSLVFKPGPPTEAGWYMVLFHQKDMGPGSYMGRSVMIAKFVETNEGDVILKRESEDDECRDYTVLDGVAAHCPVEVQS